MIPKFLRSLAGIVVIGLMILSAGCSDEATDLGVHMPKGYTLDYDEARWNFTDVMADLGEPDSNNVFYNFTDRLADTTHIVGITITAEGLDPEDWPGTPQEEMDKFTEGWNRLPSDAFMNKTLSEPFIEGGFTCLETSYESVPQGMSTPVLVRGVMGTRLFGDSLKVIMVAEMQEMESPEVRAHFRTFAQGIKVAK